MAKYLKEDFTPFLGPTGHYWFALGKFLQDSGMKPVHVNPHHVKKSKELDDNNPNKNDRKDPKTIAALVSGFIAEVGDTGRFDNPKQLQKLAGYEIVANDSDRHNGESRISYRSRKRLRYVLYEAAISLIGKNAEFREIHEYYRKRKENPLKKIQSVVAANRILKYAKIP